MTARLRAPSELSTAAIQAAVIRIKARPKPTLPARVNTEICSWLEANFYIAAAVQARAAAIREAQAHAEAVGEEFNEDDVPDVEETNEGRIVIAPHQKCLLRLALTRGPDGRLPFNAVVWSSTKKTGKCLAAGEEVLLADGSWIAAENLIGETIEIPAYGLDRHSITSTSAVVRDNGLKRCLEVRTQLGRCHIRTREHPFLTVDGWRTVEQLRVGDKIAVPLVLPEPEAGSPISEDEARILGYMIADGSTSSGHCAFTQMDGSTTEEFTAICKAWGLIVRRSAKYGHMVSSPTRGTSGHNRLRELLRREGIDGKTSLTKRVPANVFRSTNKIVEIFLSRLFACDGWAVEQTIGYGTISSGLARDVQRLLLRLGIQSKIDPKRCQKCTGGYSYEVTLSDRTGIMTFADCVGIFGKEAAVTEARRRAEQRTIKRARLVDVFPSSIWDRLHERAKLLGRRDFFWTGWHEVRESWAPRRDVVYKAAKELGDDELLALASAPIGWDRIVEISDVGEKPTISISVPGPETFVTESIEHNSAIAAGVGFWMAETQTVFGDIAAIGNDAKQSRERSFRDIRRAIMLTPGFDKHRKVLPGRWIVQETQLTCIPTQSRIVPLALDAAGEAGGATAITLWTEAWGLISKEALTMYAEMAPAPTLPDSIRWVESYAGFEDESMLLWNLYEQRESEHAHQLTAHDLAMAGSLNKRLDILGERYEDLLDAFAETEGDPEALVPVWVNEQTGMMIYWDEGEVAHRMPWLKGEKGRRYYATERATQTPNTYERIHLNHWVGSEESFVPMELWERCRDMELGPLARETPIVLGVDAASTQDCFAIVAVSRHPKRPADPAIRAARVWKPPPRGAIDYDEPEAFMRWLLVGGCPLGHPPPQPERGGMSSPTTDVMRATCPACIAGERVAPHNVIQIAFDAFQLENMMGRFNREGLTWIKKFPQMGDRLIADRQLHTVIITGRLSWDFARPEDADAMRQHIRNANAKLQKNDDSKMRLQKKSQNLKIDLAVAASMAVDRCLRIIM